MSKFDVSSGMLLVFGFLAVVAVSGPSYSYSQAETVVNRDELALRIGQGKPSVGVLLGMANAEGSFENGLNYGIEASFRFSEPFSTIVELSGYTTDRSTSEPGLTRTKLLAKIVYNFGGVTPVVRYSYAGAGVGPVYDNVGSVQKWNLGLAPQVGFDIPVGEEDSKFSLGANVAFLLVTGGSPNSASASGVAKYWF